MQKLERTIGIVCAIILLIVVVESVHPKKYVPPPAEPPVPEMDCIGDPIAVDFPYTGGVNDPWTCKVQCDGSKPRYILYSNTKATQCDIPPSCLDYGEDHGITCKVPVLRSTKK